MESKRRQKRSRSEKRIQESSGVLRTGTLASLLESFWRIFFRKNNMNPHKERKSDTDTDRTTNTRLNLHEKRNNEYNTEEKTT